MKLTLTLVAIFCIILVGGCADIQTKGGTLNPAPPWVQEEAAAYLEAKLGKDYVDMYISFKQSFSGPIKKKHAAKKDCPLVFLEVRQNPMPLL